MPETWFAVEMTMAESGDSYFAVLRDAEALANYVRVNANDLGSMKISAVDPSTLAEARIKETFADA
jgi:hypothetical protein